MLSKEIEVDDLWSAQLDLIKAFGGIEGFLNELEANSKIYDLHCKRAVIVCIDDRVKKPRDEKDSDYYYVRSAGTLLLLNENEKKIYIEHSGASVATWHKECGAAEKKFRELNPEKEYVMEDVNIFAEDSVKDLERFGLEIKEVPIESPGFHPAIGAIYTAVDMDLSQTALEHPNLFGINRNHTPKERAKEELGIALGIGFGGHGFAEKFTEKNPFYLIVAGNRKGVLSKNALMQEAKDVVDSLGYGNRVKIMGFDAPSAYA